MRLSRIIGLWLPVAAMMSLLFYLSSRSDIPGVPNNWDKLLHLGAYTLLGLLALRAFHGGWWRLRCWPALGALLLSAGYGALDELHQSSVAGRHASLGDWLADLGGALLALVLVAMALAVRRLASTEGKGVA